LTGVRGKELDCVKVSGKRLGHGDKAEEQGRVHDFVGGGDV
jgi:hypothetical protein